MQNSKRNKKSGSDQPSELVLRDVLRGNNTFKASRREISNFPTPTVKASLHIFHVVSDQEKKS